MKKTILTVFILTALLAIYCEAKKSEKSKSENLESGKINKQQQSGFNGGSEIGNKKSKKSEGSKNKPMSPNNEP
ncbi:hypothetical protein PVAND_004297 [Polypedilum vanderplanki]|uniref:Lipoprotein n=1 Tax=Polypedilum vanderplanki TaxID=319348 RepID=A0A9J6BX96_POLVA|nr:hypothetical protein PVAND_004297 [Polypedilum vanderplanki]